MLNTLKPGIIKQKYYQKALKRLDEIFDSPAKSAEGDEAELIVLLVENY